MTPIDRKATHEQIGGPMAQLTASERQVRQREVLATAPRRYGLDARAIFWLEDRAWGTQRTLSKFKARELVAGAPYRAWAREHDDAHADEMEAENERCHREVLRSLLDDDGEREDPLRFTLLPALGLAAMYAFSLIQHRIDPRRSHRLNADIEDHAAHEYALMVNEHPEWERRPYRPAVRDYGTYASRADVLRQICCDEQEHRARSVALAQSNDGVVA